MKLIAIFNISILFLTSVSQADTKLQKGAFGQYNSVKLVSSAIENSTISVIAKNTKIPSRKLTQLVKIFREDNKLIARKTLNFIHKRRLAFFRVQESLSNQKLPKKIFVIFPNSKHFTYFPPTHYEENEEDIFNSPYFSNNGDNWMLFLKPLKRKEANLPRKLKKAKFFKRNKLYKIDLDHTAFRVGENLTKRIWDEKIFPPILKTDIKRIYQLKKYPRELKGNKQQLDLFNTDFAKKVFLDIQ